MTDSPAYYAVIPASVRYDSRLKPNAKLLYGEITALCNKEGYCWAQNKYFSSLYSVTKTTISDWVKNLKDCGYIEVQINYREGSKEIVNRYIRLSEGATQEIQNTPPQKIQKDNTTKLNTTITTTLNNNHFEYFWMVYPRRVGKSEARKAWGKKVLNEDVVKAIAVNIEQRVLQGEWSDVKFIPYPSTYLNQERWKDDLQVNAQNRMPQKPKEDRRLRDIPIDEQLADTSWYTGEL